MVGTIILSTNPNQIRSFWIVSFGPTARTWFGAGSEFLLRRGDFLINRNTAIVYLVGQRPKLYSGLHGKKGYHMIRVIVSLPPPLPVSVNYWQCSVGISVSVLQFCQNPTIGYFLCTIWREHLLKISRELFFWKFGGNSFCPSKEGAEAPPLPLGKGGSRQF